MLDFFVDKRLDLVGARLLNGFVKKRTLTMALLHKSTRPQNFPLRVSGFR